MVLAWLRRAVRYSNRFGFKAGWQAARLPGPGRGLAAVSLPHLPRPLWGRRGSADAAAFDQVFLSQELELPLPGLAPAHILDLGANAGYASVAFAARWPHARILSLEPAGDNFALLRRNAEGWPSITALQAAAWPHPARVGIANPSGPTNAYRLAEVREGGIPGYTVPQLMVRQGWRRLDLVRIDLEGAEADIFRQADVWLDRVGVLVIELHDRVVPGCAETFYRALHGRRFRQEVVGRNIVVDLRPSSGRAAVPPGAAIRGWASRPGQDEAEDGDIALTGELADLAEGE